MDVSTKLRNLRKSHGLTLAKLSQKTGLSVSFLSDIERGRVNASLESLSKIALCYTMPVDEILRGIDIHHSTNTENLPPGFAEFLERNPDADLAIVDLMRSSESRALTRNKSVEDWVELYYALKRIYSR